MEASSRVVYYSIANSPAAPCERQWLESIRSLRRYNPTLPVHLFLFNGATAPLLEAAARYDVSVQYLGDYREYLYRLHVRGDALSSCPTFHKFLALDHACLGTPEQLLYLDCDTYFFDNVERLFDSYGQADWYAREEPGSRHSPHGYDPTHIDEDQLANIAKTAGSGSFIPFNSGVCLLSGHMRDAIPRVRATFLDLAWRLLAGQRLPKSPDNDFDAALLDALRTLTAEDRARALSYPSANTWIVEQIALWLALGHLSHLSQGFMSAADIAQGSEFYEGLGKNQPVLVHYFSVLEREFFAAIRTRAHH